MSCSVRKVYWKPNQGAEVWLVCYKSRSIQRFLAAGKNHTHEKLYVGLPEKETGIAFSFTCRSVSYKDCYPSKQEAVSALVSYLTQQRDNLLLNAKAFDEDIERVQKEYQ